MAGDVHGGRTSLDEGPLLGAPDLSVDPTAASPIEDIFEQVRRESGNRQWILRSRPEGHLPTTLDLSLVAADNVAVCDEYPIMVDVTHLSLDPACLGWMKQDTYYPAIEIGAVIRGNGIGVVRESLDPQYPAGTRVFGMFGWQNQCLCQRGDFSSGSNGIVIGTIPAAISSDAAALLYGASPAAAYFGLTDIGCPQPGETVLVSGANGSVGIIVGQLAKHLGCRVIGTARGEETCQLLVDRYHFDEVIDSTVNGFRRLLRRAVKDSGVDVFFDNVGGEVLKSALVTMNNSGRVALCGGSAVYDDMTATCMDGFGLLSSIFNRVRIQGFVAPDYVTGDAVEAAATTLNEGLRDGWLTVDVNVDYGIESTMSQFLSLYDPSVLSGRKVTVLDEDADPGIPLDV